MTIHFIPNDPSAIGDLPMRTVTPRPDRLPAVAHLRVAGAAAEATYAPGTPEFLYWQCREGALAAIEAWEAIHGAFASWQEDATLDVLPDEGEDLNAYYDRSRGSQPDRISFFHQKIGAKTYFSGASTDVVAHEAGHAFLDAIRPDFWSSLRFEVNAIHEAFGDCIAIVTALHDKATRQKVLPDVSGKNFLETTAEELSAAIKKFDPTHNAAAPRRARNDFEWGPQGAIPETGGPGDLIYEEHSFGQVFSGCFYDTIVNILDGMSSHSEANLLKATQAAGKLLVKAIQQAPQRAQYFREVGRFMILADEDENGGANAVAIKDAFARHNIALGTSLTLAPQAAFATVAAAGRRAVSGRATAALDALTAGPRRRLAELIGAESATFDITPVMMAGRSLQQAVHERIVPLDAVHKKLKGVIATAPQVALVGQSHQALSIMGHVSNAEATVKDVETYVSTLVKNGRIDFEPEPPKRRSARSAVGGEGAQRPTGVTHEVREARGKKELVRVRFACGDCDGI